jgi:hypothetical protein
MIAPKLRFTAWNTEKSAPSIAVATKRISAGFTAVHEVLLKFCTHAPSIAMATKRGTWLEQAQCIKSVGVHIYAHTSDLKTETNSLLSNLHIACSAAWINFDNRNNELCPLLTIFINVFNADGYRGSKLSIRISISWRFVENWWNDVNASKCTHSKCSEGSLALRQQEITGFRPEIAATVANQG